MSTDLFIYCTIAYCSFVSSINTSIEKPPSHQTNYVRWLFKHTNFLALCDNFFIMSSATTWLQAYLLFYQPFYNIFDMESFFPCTFFVCHLLSFMIRIKCFHIQCWWYYRRKKRKRKKQKSVSKAAFTV